jgi:hypothetical protein
MEVKRCLSSSKYYNRNFADVRVISENLKIPVSKISSEAGTDSSFGIVMRLRVEGLRRRGCTACTGKGSFSSPKRSKQLLGSLNLIFLV